MTALGVVPPFSGAPFGSNGFGLATRTADHRAHSTWQAGTQYTAHGTHTGTLPTAHGTGHARRHIARNHRTRKHMAGREAGVCRTGVWLD